MGDLEIIFKKSHNSKTPNLPIAKAMDVPHREGPRFKELCGATICRDIKGIDTGKVLCSCEDCVRNATEIVAEQMNKQVQ